MKAIKEAVEYLRKRGAEIPVDVMVLAYGRELKQAGFYQAIRSNLWSSIYSAIYSYLVTPDTRITTYKNSMKQGLVEAIAEAGELGFVEGGGGLPISDYVQGLIASEQAAQLAYVEGLFERLRELKKETDFDPIEEALNRAEGYCRSLDMLYNAAKLDGSGNKMLVFTGMDGADSCKDCQKYQGQRHRASWWIRHNAIPPNRDFECHGYRCYHILVDDNGVEYTI